MNHDRLFGTDGVRGVANVEPMTPETVMRIGRAVAALSARQQSSLRIVIGRDTRLSGAMLEAALAAGMTSAGAEVILAGELPTPAVALLARTAADAGAVVSASHNPFADNGIKFFGADGFKLSDETEREIEALVANIAVAEKPRTGDAIGRIRPLPDAAVHYKRFLVESLPSGFSLDGAKVVIDCAHGAAHRVGPEVFEGLGATVVALGNAPDGLNINRECGAMHPAALQAAVRDQNADFGIALDGDADRVLLIDDQGDVVDGDEILAVLTEEERRHGALQSGAIVGTVMSNMGLEIALRERNLQLLRAPVGDRYVVDQMRRSGVKLGGEPSGHIVLLDRHTTGDGLLAALAMCRVMRDTGRRLADLRKIMTRFPQVLVNVHVEKRRDLSAIASLQATIARVEQAFDGRGRVLVRFSGTEPLVRVMVEGEDGDAVKAYAAEIAHVVERELKA